MDINTLNGLKVFSIYIPIDDIFTGIKFDFIGNIHKVDKVKVELIDCKNTIITMPAGTFKEHYEGWQEMDSKKIYGITIGLVDISTQDGETSFNRKLE